MGGTSASTSLISQLVQSAIPPRRGARKYLYYRPKLLFFTKLDNIFVQYNFGKVCFTDLSEESIHLRVQRNSLLLWKGLLIQVADDFPMFKRIKLICFKVINFSLIPSSSKIEVCLNITHATPLQRCLV